MQPEKRKPPAVLMYSAALAGCILVVCLIAATADDIGWTCDEVYYFNSSELIITWTSALFKALSHGNPGAILSASITDQYWLWDMPHNPHPPLYKIISALTLVLFKQYLGEFICLPALLSAALYNTAAHPVLYYTEALWHSCRGVRQPLPAFYAALLRACPHRGNRNSTHHLLVSGLLCLLARTAQPCRHYPVRHFMGVRQRNQIYRAFAAHPLTALGSCLP